MARSVCPTVADGGPAPATTAAAASAAAAATSASSTATSASAATTGSASGLDFLLSGVARLRLHGGHSKLYGIELLLDRGGGRCASGSA